MEMLNFVYAYVDLLPEIKVAFVSFYFILGWNNLLAKKINLWSHNHFKYWGLNVSLLTDVHIKQEIQSAISKYCVPDDNGGGGEEEELKKLKEVEIELEG